MLDIRKVVSHVSQILFSPLDWFNYSIARFFFYMGELYLLHRVNFADVTAWLKADLHSFYAPVSFFSLLPPIALLPVSLAVFFKYTLYLSLFCCSFGLFFRFFSWSSFLLALLLVGFPLNFGKIHHAWHMPIVIMGILACSGYAGRISVDHWLKTHLKGRQGQSPAELSVVNWTVRTIQIYMCLVYFAAGFQKLRNSGIAWISATNMASIILTRPTVTVLGRWVAQYDWICFSIAAATVSIELLAPLALFSRAFRIVLIPSLFLFHISAYATMGDHGYFFPYNVCFVFWVPWNRLASQIQSLARKKLEIEPRDGGLNAVTG